MRELGRSGPIRLRISSALRRLASSSLHASWAVPSCFFAGRDFKMSSSVAGNRFDNIFKRVFGSLEEIMSRQFRSSQWRSKALAELLPLVPKQYCCLSWHQLMRRAGRSCWVALDRHRLAGGSTTDRGRVALTLKALRSPANVFAAATQSLTAFCSAGLQVPYCAGPAAISTRL